jgi:hypothetical protein
MLVMGQSSITIYQRGSNADPRENGDDRQLE